MTEEGLSVLEWVLDFGVAGRRGVTVYASVRNIGEFVPLIEVEIKSIKAHLPVSRAIADGLRSEEVLHLIEPRHLIDVRFEFERKFKICMEHTKAEPEYDYPDNGPVVA